jgi:cytidine deaminase
MEVIMNEENEQKNSLVRQEKGELLNKQGLVSHSVVRNLIIEAKEGMKKAYVPYSHFQVGAALLTNKHMIYRGCNIENAAYSSSICAERTAFVKAVSEGIRDFVAIAIIGGKEGIITDYCPPCGVCRQVMHEFVDTKQFLVIMAKSEDDYLLYFLEELLPMGFGLS